ncbi:hypothetical protein ACJX0J_033509, partial [Zea mays]
MNWMKNTHNKKIRAQKKDTGHKNLDSCASLLILLKRKYMICFSFFYFWHLPVCVVVGEQVHLTLGIEIEKKKQERGLLRSAEQSIGGGGGGGGVTRKGATE